MTAAALELRGIDKRFGPVIANRGVDLRVDAGAVHAVVGENGAGKSTLMKVAYGLVRADAGTVVLRGEEIARDRHTPAQALARKVGMVHQHFMLVGPLTVIENVVLGSEPTRRGLLDLRTAGEALVKLAERFGFAVDPCAAIDELSVGEQQRVEILKVLWRGCEVLILDEPTAVLTPGEVRELFAVLRAWVGEGHTVVLITHKLDEVAAIADRVTVMRKGEKVAELARPLEIDEIARAMVGRDVGRARSTTGQAARPARDGAAPALALDELRVAGRGGRLAVDGLTLSVAAGEIVGVAGVEGNGQTELVEALAGLRAAADGRIALAGRDVTRANVTARYAAGLGVVPEDRHRRGLVLPFSAAENLILGRQREMSGRVALDRARVAAHAAAQIEAFDIQPARPDAPVAGLSGGNQQKVVVARELSRPGLAALVCAQPTRGVDIGAIEQIHARLRQARAAGVGVLLISAELSELRALADRVMVIYRGRFVYETHAAALAEPEAFERLGEYMVGAGGAP